MKHTLMTAKADISESLRSKWFLIYSIVFGGIIALLFAFGLTESRIMGFVGLSRLLITYIQLSMAILPIFILITTVRSVAGDRDAGIFEYLLSLPISLSSWFWGKMFGRFTVVFLPVFLAMAGAIAWGVIQDMEIPWSIFLFYTAMLFSLSWCFLGIGMLISTIARSPDVAQGSAFMIWLFLLLFLDLILLGIMIQQQIPSDTIVAIALSNPLQVFRTASMLLFDPQLVLLGPSAYLILDHFGEFWYLVWAMAYPLVLGTVAASVGYMLFRRGDQL
ncbi:MAG: ABC transporter permease subunit [Gammaproteobacteria bacterium]|uniref:ABC transporter permease subunit n=1 Tax=Candidatus Thiopontia autotrophica TaxID=2841688 RepID=A0A8J6P7G8_9GAMM|nr:ABC transporter permease subunit [Candidatus Thiopontia autotrophica]MBL6969022.1 ABC transporter permease subunit [Gammaproteobacteria bacterium]